jgi:hypothetical protein
LHWNPKEGVLLAKHYDLTCLRVDQLPTWISKFGSEKPQQRCRDEHANAPNPMMLFGITLSKFSIKDYFEEDGDENGYDCREKSKTLPDDQFISPFYLFDLEHHYPFEFHENKENG